MPLKHNNAYWRFVVLVAFILLTIASCNTEKENIVPEADVQIGFGVTMSATGRSLVTDATQMGSFKVWGWRTPQNQAVKGNVFNGTTVSYDATNGWTYSPLQSWVLYNNYDFYALYPDTLSGINYNEVGQLSFDCLDIRQSGEYNTDHALDVMHVHQAVEVVNTPPDIVVLTFDHLLTNINIDLQMSPENEGDRMEVTNILLNGMNCVGSMQDGVWELSEPSYLWDKLDVTQELQIGVSKRCFADVLMIPQRIEAEQVMLYVVYNYTQKGNSAVSTRILQTFLPAGEWKSGERLVYTGSIQVDNSIVFSKPQVESWGTEQVGGTVIIK